MKRIKIQKNIERKKQKKQKGKQKKREKRSHNREKAATGVTHTFCCSSCSDSHKNS